MHKAYEANGTVPLPGLQDEISLHTDAPKTLRISFLPRNLLPPEGNKSQLVQNFHLRPHSPARPFASEGRRRMCGRRFRNASQPCEQLPWFLSSILLALIPRSFLTLSFHHCLRTCLGCQNKFYCWNITLIFRILNVYTPDSNFQTFKSSHTSFFFFFWRTNIQSKAYFHTMPSIPVFQY